MLADIHKVANFNAFYFNEIYSPSLNVMFTKPMCVKTMLLVLNSLVK